MHFNAVLAMEREWVHLCTLVRDVEQSTARFLATMATMAIHEKKYMACTFPRYKRLPFHRWR